MRQLRQKAHDNAEAALRNRRAFAGARQKHALVAQAFQSAAAVFASAAED
ncbi:MAG: hypothetical protein ACPIOQ_75855 [Promethearchaeia archaeon]